MKFSVTLLLIAGICLWSFMANKVLAGNSAENEVEKAVHQRYGKNLRGLTRSHDPFWNTRLQGYKVYEIDVFNPSSDLAGRPILWYTLIVPPKGELIFIEDFIEDHEKTLAFMQGMAVLRKAPLDELPQWYARLRRMRILSSSEDIGKTPLPGSIANQEKEKQIAPPVYHVEIGQALFYVLDDPGIASVLRIDLNRKSTGVLTMKAKPFSARGGYQ